ncbi:MAG: SufE family protein [Odoribacteraceae bacterium]|jgi:cysteine desulfuration protein SufE|nr:SufE family protein [Odoribacteraceae bacterium]
MKTIKEQENEIIDEFAVHDDWMDKYAYLIEIGTAIGPMDERYKNDENLIKGCQSRVWLHAESREGRLYFQADSDAIIPKGIAALLVRVFSGQPPREILDAGLEFIDAIGLTQHLAPTRSNGLLSMVKQIKYYALAFHEKN